MTKNENSDDQDYIRYRGEYPEVLTETALKMLFRFKMLLMLGKETHAEWEVYKTLPELIDNQKGEVVEDYVARYFPMERAAEPLTEDERTLYAPLVDEDLMRQVKLEYPRTSKTVQSMLLNEQALRRFAFQLAAFEGCVYGFLIDDVPKNWNQILAMLRTKTALFRDNDETKAFLEVGNYLRYFDAEPQRGIITYRRFRRFGLLFGLMSLSLGLIERKAAEVLAKWVVDDQNSFYVDGDLIELIGFALGSVPPATAETILAAYPVNMPRHLQEYLFAYVAGGNCKDSRLAEQMLNSALSEGISDYAIHRIMLQKTAPIIRDYINSIRLQRPAIYFYGTAAFRLNEVTDSEDAEYADLAAQDVLSLDFETHFRGVIEYGIIYRNSGNYQLPELR